MILRTLKRLLLRMLFPYRRGPEFLAVYYPTVFIRSDGRSAEQVHADVVAQLEPEGPKPMRRRYTLRLDDLMAGERYRIGYRRRGWGVALCEGVFVKFIALGRRRGMWVEIEIAAPPDAIRAAALLQSQDILWIRKAG